jgi:hypothetical protein
MTEILLKVALLNIITPEFLYFNGCQYCCVITVYLQLYGADHVLFCILNMKDLPVLINIIF